MSLVNKNWRFSGTPEAADFRMVGVDYVVNPNLSLSYQYGELDDIYGQHYFGLLGNTAVGPASWPRTRDTSSATTRATRWRVGSITARSMCWSRTARLTIRSGLPIKGFLAQRPCPT